VDTVVRKCPEECQKEKYSVLFNILIANPAEGQSTFLHPTDVRNGEVL